LIASDAAPDIACFLPTMNSQLSQLPKIVGLGARSFRHAPFFLAGPFLIQHLETFA
jgi:hypothetical protein